MERYRILIVEDDGVIAEQVKNYLEKWGLEVFCVKDFHNVPGEFSETKPHLVILDIGLLFFNGHYWCGQIRQISQVPVIFMSSAGDNMNIVRQMS